MERKKIFSERLGLLLDRNGTYAKDLAQHLKLHKSSVSLYLAGKSFPTVDNLLEIADFFNVSVDYLVGRTTDQKSHLQFRYPQLDEGKERTE
ncbi:helix-turn-helix domain-containing protein [Brevibacillus sp. NPDC003359]|uniref:helix-turn-helix domain-containing protein n=1 Tax=unclassified Brevibacillus TaxID=2684853 RepID=UPI0036B1A792